MEFFSKKYEDIYIKSYENMTELSEGVSRYFTFTIQKSFISLMITESMMKYTVHL